MTREEEKIQAADECYPTREEHNAGFYKGAKWADHFDWQSFRAEAAKDILCNTLNGGIASGMIGIIPGKETIVKASIEIADELIKQLKEKEEK